MPQQLSQPEFTVLYEIIKGPGLSQRAYAEKCNLSLGSMNHYLNLLKERGLVDDEGSRITATGQKALKPYKVDNAVIMAAGMSSRFAPLSYEKPKALFRVRGEILIERQIQQLQEAGIKDITVVVGYLKEQFFYLEEKYGVRIVVNEDYYRYNNTSSLIRVSSLLKNTYICSADNYFTENVFHNYEFQQYYSAAYADGETEEWALKIDRKNCITHVTIGGENTWFMIGHVYFSRDFSRKFVEILKNSYKHIHTRENLWEDLFARNIKELPLYIKKFNKDVIFEFDNIAEARNFDPNFLSASDSVFMQNISVTLSCPIQEITNIQPIKDGVTNISFKFTTDSGTFVYRHPRPGSQQYINWKNEATTMRYVKDLGLDKTFIYIDENDGWKISAYAENTRGLNYHDRSEVEGALSKLKVLHDHEIQVPYVFDLWERITHFIDEIRKSGRGLPSDFKEMHKRLFTVKEECGGDNSQLRLCHCDAYASNFLVDADGIEIIDWEYSGMSDPAVDLGLFICCSDYDYEQTLKVFEIYYGHSLTKTEQKHFVGYVALASYYCFLWAIYQESIGKIVGESLYHWYKNAKFFAEKALALD